MIYIGYYDMKGASRIYHIRVVSKTTACNTIIPYVHLSMFWLLYLWTYSLLMALEKQ